jgi:hypothetical protein
MTLMCLAWFLAGTAVGAGVANVITSRAMRELGPVGELDELDDDEDDKGYPDEYDPGMPRRSYVSDIDGETDN